MALIKQNLLNTRHTNCVKHQTVTWIDRVLVFIQFHVMPICCMQCMVQINSSTVCACRVAGWMEILPMKIFFTLYASKWIQVSIRHNDDILFNGPFRFWLTRRIFCLTYMHMCVKYSTNHINIHHLGISPHLFPLSKRLAFCKLFHQQMKWPQCQIIRKVLTMIIYNVWDFFPTMFIPNIKCEVIRNRWTV